MIIGVRDDHEMTKFSADLWVEKLREGAKAGRLTLEQRGTDPDRIDAGKAGKPVRRGLSGRRLAGQNSAVLP